MHYPAPHIINPSGRNGQEKTYLLVLFSQQVVHRLHWVECC